jgi:transcriptional regulator with XRE-family HTH domain
MNLPPAASFPFVRKPEHSIGLRKGTRTFFAFLQTSMARQKLQNYLRTYRKRAGFSQDEMAFLLGCRRGTKVSRYECFRRLPELQTVLAYEVVLGVPARELLAGIFEQVQRVTIRRAKTLYRRLDATPHKRLTAQKLMALREALEPK